MSSTGRVLTYASTVTSLAVAPGAIDYATEFVYGTSLSAVTADHSPSGDTFGLYLLAAQVTPIGIGAQSAPTLTGTVDPTTNMISVLLPFDTFNAVTAYGLLRHRRWGSTSAWCPRVLLFGPEIGELGREPSA